jgi:hypothetical protein
VAKGLDKLLAQINALAPNRSKASDGSIGDPEHQGRPSDHNPDAQGVVRARDFTHDPAHGADMGKISEALRLSRDRRIKYVIFNRRIFSATTQPWVWRPYTGSNPHDKHMHVSVVPTSVADDTSPWEITMPLTSDDIKRVSDATAAKVLGRAWSVPGRTLAGSVEAIIFYTQNAASAASVAHLTDLVEQVLAEVSADPVINVTVEPQERGVIAQRVVERLIPAEPAEAPGAGRQGFAD